MTNRERAKRVKEFLDLAYGKVQVFLNFDHSKPWQFLICVMLSAQSTDASVNQVTPLLFERYPTLEDLASASPADIERIVKRVGLAPTKSRHIVETARIITRELGGEIPLDRKKLTELPGVGHKTAGVFLGELYGFSYLPVDTHVERVAKTLEFVRGNPDRKHIEETLERAFKGLGEMIDTHKQLILFGRTFLRPGVTSKEAWDYIDRRTEELKRDSE